MEKAKDLVEKMLAKANWIHCTSLHIVDNGMLDVCFPDKRGNEIVVCTASTWDELLSSLLSRTCNVLSANDIISIDFNVVKHRVFNEA